MPRAQRPGDEEGPAGTRPSPSQKAEENPGRECRSRGGGLRPGRRGGELGGGLLRRQQDGRPGATGPGKVALTRPQFLCSGVDRTDRVCGEIGWRQGAQTAFEGGFLQKGRSGWGQGRGGARREGSPLRWFVIVDTSSELGTAGHKQFLMGARAAAARRRTGGQWPGGRVWRHTGWACRRARGLAVQLLLVSLQVRRKVISGEEGGWVGREAESGEGGKGARWRVSGPPRRASPRAPAGRVDGLE